MIHLPLARPSGQTPPCGECPKIDPDQPDKHWRHAAEFAPWFWDALDEFRERRVCGTLGDADPLMRQAFVLFDGYADSLRARQSAEPILEFLVAAFSPR